MRIHITVKLAIITCGTNNTLFVLQAMIAMVEDWEQGYPKSTGADKIRKAGAPSQSVISFN